MARQRAGASVQTSTSAGDAGQSFMCASRCGFCGPARTDRDARRIPRFNTRTHCYPVKWRTPSLRTSMGAACRSISLGIDLNFDDQELRSFPGLTSSRSVFSDNKVRPTHADKRMIFGQQGRVVPARVLPLLRNRTDRLLRIMLRLLPDQASHRGHSRLSSRSGHHPVGRAIHDAVDRCCGALLTPISNAQSSRHLSREDRMP